MENLIQEKISSPEPQSLWLPNQVTWLTKKKEQGNGGSGNISVQFISIDSQCHHYTLAFIK